MTSRDPLTNKAKEEIFDAIRFLAPDVAEQVLRELADGMKKLANEYDRKLESLVFS